MRWQVFYNVALNVAADNADVIMAFDFEVEQSRFEAAFAQHRQQLVEIHLDRQRVCVTTKNNSRNHAIAACLTSGALACPRAFLNFKIWDLSGHNNSP